MISSLRVRRGFYLLKLTPKVRASLRTFFARNDRTGGFGVTGFDFEIKISSFVYRTVMYRNFYHIELRKSYKMNDEISDIYVSLSFSK